MWAPTIGALRAGGRWGPGPCPGCRSGLTAAAVRACGWPSGALAGMWGCHDHQPPSDLLLWLPGCAPALQRRQQRHRGELGRPAGPVLAGGPPPRWVGGRRRGEAGGVWALRHACMQAGLGQQPPPARWARSRAAACLPTCRSPSPAYPVHRCPPTCPAASQRNCGGPDEGGLRPLLVHRLLPQGCAAGQAGYLQRGPLRCLPATLVRPLRHWGGGLSSRRPAHPRLQAARGSTL